MDPTVTMQFLLKESQPFFSRPLFCLGHLCHLLFKSPSQSYKPFDAKFSHATLESREISGTSRLCYIWPWSWVVSSGQLVHGVEVSSKRMEPWKLGTTNRQGSNVSGSNMPSFWKNYLLCMAKKNILQGAKSIQVEKRRRKTLSN